MLIEIKCDKFREGSISFHAGLNVVLGDDNASNSIGKSTLLMVIDFAFGGNAFITHNTDVVGELGHHDYFFAFLFDGEVHRFRRGTYRSDLVYKCDESYEQIEPISREAYTAFLKEAYKVDIPKLSFRNLVGLYARIWGKDNLNVYKPLHAVQTQPAKECIDTLIKTYNRFDAIEDLASRLKQSEGQQKALRTALEQRVVPRIGKGEYEKNEAKLQKIESEIEDIKRNLAKYATNIAELGNREVLELKEEKDELLAVELNVEGKLRRVQRNLAENRHIRSRNLDDLRRFFPTVNTDRLAAIEEFHNGLARILKTELVASREDLEGQLDTVRRAIGTIDEKLALTLRDLDNPSVFVDRVFDLTKNFETAKNENKYYDANQELTATTKALRNQLSEERGEIIALIQDLLNDTIRRIVSKVFGADHKSPEIRIGDSNYEYEIYKDTGTGTAYSNLIVFDLAVFTTTVLPTLSHDSLLFKNIENNSVAGLLQVYISTERQSFVAIDEVDKYGVTAATLLRENSVIQLSDQKVLYTKDWRKR